MQKYYFLLYLIYSVCFFVNHPFLFTFTVYVVKKDITMNNSQAVGRTPRIEVVDALRGFAILAIVLVHNIEHFNLYSFPETNSVFLNSLNAFVWDAVFFLFGGKAYAIFALLFGFSYYIQLKNRERQGKDFCGRFLWRLVILAGFGWLHAVFYTGDILILYAMIGLVLVPVRKASDKWVCLLASFLMLQPLEIGKLAYALFTPDYILPGNSDALWLQTQEGLKSSSFITMVKSSLCNGELYSLTWAWNNGRFFQTASLFMFGMLLGRKELFINSEQTIAFWKKILIIGVVCFVPLFLFLQKLPGLDLRPALLVPLKVIVSSWTNVVFMFVLVSLFLLCWYQTRLHNVFTFLIPCGKMSLTNYISQSAMGSFIYFGYGLALYQHLGITYSFLTGVGLFLLQLLFCNWWLKNYRQGPLEMIWHKLTWIRL